MKNIFRNEDLPYNVKEEIILRDYLAIERTRLANERTLFAYIRTSLYLVLAGLTIIQLNQLGSILWIGIISLVSSAVFLIIGITRYRKLNIQLKNYYNNTRKYD